MIHSQKRREGRDVSLSAELFRDVQLGRNNRHYRLLIKICELVFESLIPGEGEEESRFAILLDDEVRMSELFEKFVRNFYITEQHFFKVRAEQLEWHATFDDPRNEAYLPQMRTDLTMRTAGRTIVMDTKYYREILSRTMGGLAKLRSGHLYQLMTYLRQVRCDVSVPHVAEGLLLYARAGGLDLNVAYTVGGFRIRACTIDLNVDWRTSRFRIQFIDACESIGVAAKAVGDDGWWRSFLEHFSEVVRDCPLEARARNTKYVTRVTASAIDPVTIGIVNRQFAICWQWECRDRDTPGSVVSLF